MKITNLRFMLSIPERRQPELDTLISDTLQSKTGKSKVISFWSTSQERLILPMTSLSPLEGYCMEDMPEGLWATTSEAPRCNLLLSASKRMKPTSDAGISSQFDWPYKSVILFWNLMICLDVLDPSIRTLIHESGGVLSDRNHDRTYLTWDM